MYIVEVYLLMWEKGSQEAVGKSEVKPSEFFHFFLMKDKNTQQKFVQNGTTN